jgi:ABC-type Na+ efflux pump permease subunit
MRILNIALKDLVQILRDKKSLVFLVLMPVAFTVFMGFAFRTSNEDPRLPVGWVDKDPAGSLTNRLRDLVAGTGGIDLVPLEGDEADRAAEQVRNEKLVAAVTVPEGFSGQALAGEPLPLAVVVPNTMAGQTATTALQAAAKRLLAAVEAARLGVDVGQATSPLPTRPSGRQHWKTIWLRPSSPGSSRPLPSPWNRPRACKLRQPERPAGSCNPRRV